MLTIILASIAGGLTNVLRGQGIINRVIACIGFSLITSFVIFGASLSSNLLFYPMLFCSMLLLWSFGWGKYFMAIHGEDKRSEKEFVVADYWLDKLDIKNNYLYGIVGMGIRWAILGLPLSIIVAFFTPTYEWNSVLLMVGLYFVGVFYWIGGRISQKWSVVIGEFLTAFFIILSIGV
jgi:hypothetical protein